jgi:phosphohistidine phosphatase
MTLRLILIRHAKSDWSVKGQSDHDRALNLRGARQAPEIGDWLASRSYIPGQILCSDARRTRETLDLILPRLGADAARVLHLDSLYNASADQMLAHLHKASEAVVMMIGHNPGIADFAGQLSHVPPRHQRFADYPTGAVTVLDFNVPNWAEVTMGSGAVRDFVVPDDLDA